MKIIKPSYEIMDDISPFGIHELEKIEKCARVCYKSEDKILDQAESAKKLIKNLIKNGHEAMLEHSCLTVKFICDRGVSHELVRHRMASFAQESTRWCNYSQDKFGNEITVIEPLAFEDMDDAWKEDVTKSLYCVICGCDDKEILKDYVNAPTRYQIYAQWYVSLFEAEDSYMTMLNKGLSPQMARSVLPNSLKTEIVVTANYREWRHIFQLRTAKDAHPEMRRLMIPLLKDLKERIPVIFDDIEVEERDMDYNSILDLIAKAMEIIGEKEYEEIRSEYKNDTIEKTSEKWHSRKVGVARRLFTEAMKKDPDEIDLKFIATYFLMCVDMVKHNLDIDRYESDKNILKLIKTYG